MAEKESKQTSNSAEAHANRAADAISAKFSGPLAPLEKQLDEYLGEKAPIKIPKNGREAIVKFSPWISLAVGLLGLFAALGIWRAAHTTNELVDIANKYAAAIGEPAVAKLGAAFWLSIIMLVIFSVLALLAVPGLKARKKVGWNLLFLSSIANFVYGVVSIFYDNGGVGSLVSALIGTVIGLFILFQVRSYYK